MVILSVDCVYLATFAGWRELWLAWAVGSSAFHVAGTLPGQLDEVDAGPSVPGFCALRAPWQDS